MKKQIFKILLLVTLFFIGTNIVFAADINLTIRNGSTIIFSGSVPLQPAGTIELNGHTIDANSVLAVLNDADILSSDFSISDLQYYDSFGSFYIKCIESSLGNDCDNWQYVINGSYPFLSVDQEILSGGEDVYFYFGPQNKIILSDEEITTEEVVTVTTEKYDYENNSWLVREGVTVGLTQPDPNDPWSPTEVQTSLVDANGQAIFSEISEGSYNVGVQEDFYFPTETLTVIAVPEPKPRPSSGGSRPTVPAENVKLVFDVEKALEFLLSQQTENGSFGENLYTDWATIAIASMEKSQEPLSKLTQYFQNLKTENYLLTDYERHTMALLSLGLNPYNINGENYIEKIVTQFDGKQFGNPDEYNDDVFALIVLQNTGFNKDEKIINETISFILEKQIENGSWNESADMTGATLEALSKFRDDERVNDALIKAEEFLKEKQEEDGSWDNVSSTAWALQGMLALGEEIKASTKEYFGANQEEDGGIKGEDLNNRIWQTSYVLASLSGKNWNQVMQKFEKPKITIEKPIAVVVKTEVPKKITQKQNLEAVVVNALDPAPAPIIEKTEIPKKNWFERLLDKIFNIF